MTDTEIRKFLKDWDESGAIKTSLYWRLQSLLVQPKKAAAK